MGVQSDWRWCCHCHALFFNGAPSRCPRGDGHVAQGALYHAYHDVQGPALQGGWRWCRKCMGMFQSDRSVSAGCPAGGRHDSNGSAPYAVLTDVAANGEYSEVFQRGWRECSVCQALFFGDAGGGLCPGGGRHRDASGRDLMLLLRGGAAQAVFDRAAAIEANADNVVSAPAPLGGAALGKTAQPDWRWCRKCHGLYFGRSAVGCPAGGGHDAEGSAPYFAYFGVQGAGLQSDWRWCRRCQGMFFGGGVALGGACPLGGPHDSSGSADYALPCNVTERPGYASMFQHGWRWCGRCTGLFHVDGVSVCPTGGQHVPGSTTDYALLAKVGLTVDVAAFNRAAAIDVTREEVLSWAPVAPPSEPAKPVQGSWRWCRTCNVLFHEQSGPSRCAGGGAHAAEGGQYFAYVDVEGESVQRRWRWCTNCKGMFYAGGRAEAGVCAAGGAHDGSTSGPYSLLFNVQEAAAYGPTYQHRWHWCGGCQSLFHGDGGGVCPAGGKHVDGSGTDYVLLFKGTDAALFERAAAIQANYASIGVARVDPTRHLPAHIEASCRLIVDYDAAARPQNRFQVVLVPRDAAGSPLPNAKIRLYASERLTIDREGGGTITREVVDSSAGVVLTTSASGRCRFTIEPIVNRLTVPLLIAQTDAMGPGEWSVFSPDRDLHKRLAELTADEMFATPKGKLGPLLTITSDTAAAMPPAPGVMMKRKPWVAGEPVPIMYSTRADAEALAGSVSLLMTACVNHQIGVRPGNDLSFAVDEAEAPAIVLAPVLEGTAEDAERAVAPVFAVDPQAALRRSLSRPAPCSEVGAADEDGAAGEAGGAGEAVESLVSFDFLGTLRGAADTMVRTGEDIGGRIEAGGRGLLRSAEDLARAAVEAARDVASAIARSARGPVGSVAQFLDTTGAAAQVLIQRSNDAVLQPAAQFADSGVRGATQLAIDTANGITVIALVVTDGVTSLVKTVIDEVEAAAQVVVAFFRRLGMQIQLVIEFLCAMFDWDDILRTQSHLQRHFNHFLSSFDGMLQAQRAQLDGHFTALEARIAAVHPAAPVPAISLPRAALDPSSFGGPLGYLFDKLESHLGDIRVPGSDAFKALLPAFPPTAIAELQAFDAAFRGSALSAALTDPRALVELGADGLLALVAPIAGAAVKALRVTADALLACAAPIMAGLDAALKQRIYIPVVTELIELLVFRGGQSLTLQSLFTLVTAAFLTVLYKLTLNTSSAPFDDEMVSFDGSASASAQDLAITSISAIFGLFQGGLAAAAAALNAPKLAIAGAVLGFIAPFPGVPYNMSGDNPFFFEQWVNLVVNTVAAVAQLIDSTLPDGDGTLLGRVSIGCGVVMAFVTGDAHVNTNKRGDRTRADLDLGAQLTAIVNNLTPAVPKNGQPVVSAVANGAAFAVGMVLLDDIIRRPEAQLGVST